MLVGNHAALNLFCIACEKLLLSLRYHIHHVSQSPHSIIGYPPILHESASHKKRKRLQPKPITLPSCRSFHKLHLNLT
ncbi:unnamed protein product [Albugo candida]|uniref:Uncharacterized protein n=1 Tax=Albugo candida TaxID=65357 RepID=A0A024G1S4_9STRA|nr:unnamed protein product [Albugo candida]|eukprot:CCI40793.1 unnamed protein product [Albugo candida]